MNWLLVMVCVAVLLSIESAALKVVVLDVGEGLSVLLTRKGHGLLVDTGLASVSVSLQDDLQRHGIEQLDYMILSHYHPDHAGGAAAIINRFSNAQVLDNGPLPDDSPNEVKAIEANVRALTHKLHHLRKGDRLEWQGATLTALWPEQTGQGINRDSLVLRVDYGEAVMLLMGDADAYVEKQLINQDLPPRPSLLVAGHHAAADTGDPGFIEKLQPYITAVSVNSGNRYGYPDWSVIEKLNSISHLLWRTDRDGELCLLINKRSPTASMCQE